MGLLRLLLGLIVGLLGIFKFWSSDKQVKKREDAELEKRIDEVAKAIDEGNEDKVNERLKHLTRCLVLLPFCVLSLSGCVRTRVEYIPADARAVYVPQGASVTATCDSWLVPKGRLQILMEKAERYDVLCLPLPNVAKEKR